MKQFLKFGAVGFFNTLITVVTFNILVILGLNYVLSNILGYTFGIINSFYWNKKWVFKSNSGEINIIFKFVIVNLVTLGLNTFLLYLLVDHLHIRYFLSQLVATAVGMVINFILNKKWTFDKAKVGDF
ncbi:GtrA family protein [Caldifermentibacillus hisashii]|uniref:GtrA family protein n=1 Tax=Caldifermentibacillus hisashii TaxID=996558 RepID=UPI001C0FA020|nr:GtrA family protein [Caldifermentibacillus hisashii]MBU5342567.1 GtrA family protein [Caldifermentibacillus hisashii]MEC5271321.1 GtrA family protein [Caldifermentibacillus hisashii]MED3644690.1 GtrA family protein [Caldifermentibacillus hisashii]